MSDESLPNPFSYSGTIRDPEKFYGRESELARIFDRLRSMQSVSVVGERRIGKSSLLHQIYLSVKDHLGDDCRAVYTDLPDVKSESDFYRRVCQRLEVEGNSFDDLDRATRGGRVVVCLDEFERLAGNPSFSANFFNSLRSLAQTGNLAFLLATEHSLAELCQDERIATSPFWNIFIRINLGSFRRDEAEELILSGFAQEVTDKEVARLIELAGCFPFFLQMACYHLFEVKVGRASQWEQSFEEEAGDHLRYLWHRLNDAEQKALRWSLALGERLPADAVLNDLVRRGLLISGIRKQFGYWVFSEAFEGVVRNPPARPAKKGGWWRRLFQKSGSVKLGIGPVSVEVEAEKPEDKR
jgi:AAA+ ATPase superfamily predicted ATPase